MTWLMPWRKQVVQADDAVRAAEELRDHAQQQQREAEEIAPRVDAVASSLRQQSLEKPFGLMIDALLRGR